MNSKNILVAGAVLSGLAVIIGAFGSHALKPTLEAVGKAEVFETAHQYHIYHALGLLAVGLLHEKSTRIALTAYCFLAGMFFFCGSLYVLALTGIKILGAVAPVGGTAFIVGWGNLAYQIAKQPKP